MPSSHRSRRQAHDIDDFEDDDLMDAGMARQAGQEKMKQLAFDLLGRWHWIVLGLVLGLLGGFHYLSKAPRIYQARSTLLIKQQTSSVMSRGDRNQSDDMDLRTLEGLNTMADRITRQELLEKVASRPDVRALPGLVPSPVEWLPNWMLPWLGKATKASRRRAGTATATRRAGWGHRVVDEDFRAPRHPPARCAGFTSIPEAARTIANAIGTEYHSELTGARSSDQNSSLKILMEESDSARERLQKAQNALAIYQRALASLKELEAREAVLADLSRRYLPKHPKYISANSEVVAIEKRFLSEFEAARTSSADRDYWDEHAEDWQKTGNDSVAKLLTARRLLLARGNVLESEIISQNSVFNSILTRIQESDINKQAVESEMEISSTAQLPGLPVSPVASKIIGMASVGGLGFGVLLAMIFIRLDNKIHTVAQAERETGLPTLAAIAEIPLKALTAPARKHKPLPSLVVPASRQRWNPMLLFHEGVTTTTYAEMFRVLRASVSLLGDEKRRITLFSSALPGEGKTLVSSNFALAAAQQGKRTLLIDLDLRKPAVHKIFGLKRDSHPHGASEVLSGQVPFGDGILTDTGSSNLHLMLAGKEAPNPGELLDAGSLETFLEIALALYDLVVIDSAPLLAVPDTRIIVPLVDNFCLVVRADYVPKGAVRRAIAMMDHDQNPPCGIVFNSFSEKRRLIGQNYSYGNYQTNRYGKAYRYGYGADGSYGSDADK